MDAEKMLFEKLSRSKVDVLVLEAIQNQPLFDKLISLSFSDNKRLAWRAAWVLSHLHEKQPQLLEPHFAQIMEFVPQSQIDGARRSFIYILSNTSFNEYPVSFINLCFDWMLSPKQPVAIQVYCMRILVRVCKVYPDFKSELVVCLESVNTVDYSKGFASARRNVLKSLGKG
ncbi:MAG: hypothetical protein P4L28_05565 [Paludibacteraceae bacterium]|nr:hypothetical protein [Paludibacteraceae bacterium]